MFMKRIVAGVAVLAVGVSLPVSTASGSVGGSPSPEAASGKTSGADTSSAAVTHPVRKASSTEESLVIKYGGKLAGVAGERILDEVGGYLESKALALMGFPHETTNEDLKNQLEHVQETVDAIQKTVDDIKSNQNEIYNQLLGGTLNVDLGNMNAYSGTIDAAFTLFEAQSDRNWTDPNPKVQAQNQEDLRKAVEKIKNDVPAALKSLQTAMTSGEGGRVPAVKSAAAAIASQLPAGADRAPLYYQAMGSFLDYWEGEQTRGLMVYLNALAYDDAKAIENGRSPSDKPYQQSIERQVAKEYVTSIYTGRRLAGTTPAYTSGSPYSLVERVDQSLVTGLAPQFKVWNPYLLTSPPLPNPRANVSDPNQFDSASKWLRLNYTPIWAKPEEYQRLLKPCIGTPFNGHAADVRDCVVSSGFWDVPPPSASGHWGLLTSSWGHSRSGDYSCHSLVNGCYNGYDYVSVLLDNLTFSNSNILKEEHSRNIFGQNDTIDYTEWLNPMAGDFPVTSGVVSPIDSPCNNSGGFPSEAFPEDMVARQYQCDPDLRLFYPANTGGAGEVLLPAIQSFKVHNPGEPGGGWRHTTWTANLGANWVSTIAPKVTATYKLMECTITYSDGKVDWGTSGGSDDHCQLKDGTYTGTAPVPVKIVARPVFAVSKKMPDGSTWNSEDHGGYGRLYGSSLVYGSTEDTRQGALDIKSLLGLNPDCSSPPARAAQVTAAAKGKRCALLHALGVSHINLVEKRGKSRVGTVQCPSTCGKVTIKAMEVRSRLRRGTEQVVGRGHATARRGQSTPLTLKLTNAFTKRLAKKKGRTIPIRLSVVAGHIHAWRNLPIGLDRKY